MLSLNAELNKLLTDSKQTPYQRVVKILFDVGDTVAQAQLMLSGLDARVTLFSEDERIPETYWNFLRLKRLDSLPQYERFLLAGETRGWGGIGPGVSHGDRAAPRRKPADAVLLSEAARRVRRMRGRDSVRRVAAEDFFIPAD